MRIAVLAPSRHPVAEPFPGGLEAFVWRLCRDLRRRGHQVLLVAPPGSDAAVADELVEHRHHVLSPVSSTDPTCPLPDVYSDHHAMMGAVRDLLSADVDVISDHTLHFYPVVLADVLGAPVVKTLHTPPFAWLESAVALASPEVSFVCVSTAAAGPWRDAGVDPAVILNGVPEELFTVGPGGQRALWAGRITPEKDPVTAVRVAERAGLGLTLAGPVSDAGYFRDEVAPLLRPGPTGVDYVGHLDQRRTAQLMGRSSVLLMTSAWAEPYGMVAAEALMSGTPVAALRRGGLAEVVSDGVSGAVRDDVPSLVAGVTECLRLDRSLVAKDARTRLSFHRMVDDYERHFASVVPC